MSDKRIPIMCNGKFVGWGEEVDAGIINGELTSEGVKEVFPDYDPTAGLSIAVETPERAYVLPEHNVLPEHMDFGRDEDITYPAYRKLKGTFDA